MPFRYDDDPMGWPHNGNFLSSLELNSQRNKGRGNPNYLSSTVCDEFIQLMAEKVLRAIVTEVKVGKCFSIIVDSVPDVTHIDQLVLIMPEEEWGAC